MMKALPILVPVINQTATLGLSKPHDLNKQRSETLEKEFILVTIISHTGWVRTKQNIGQITFQFVAGYVMLGVSLVAQMVKNLPAMQETQV